MRGQIIYAYYGGVKPVKHREPSEDGKPEPQEPPSSGVSSDKIAAMLALQEQINQRRAASIPPDE